MDGDTILPFGPYKNQRIREHPHWYLRWLIQQPDFYEHQRQETIRYLASNPEDEYWDLSEETDEYTPEQHRIDALIGRYLQANNYARELIQPLIADKSLSIDLRKKLFAIKKALESADRSACEKMNSAD